MNPYHSMSIGDKQRATLAQAREQAVRCPACETAVMPVDLMHHVYERCPGQSEPHAAAAWIRWGPAIKLGVPDATLRLWCDTGKVRYRGQHPDREYLLRDLVVLIAARQAKQRRDRRILR